MSRLVVVAVVSSLLGSGCSAGLMAAGGGMMVAGGYTLAQPEQHCASGLSGDGLACTFIGEPANQFGNAANDAAGAVMLVAGATMLIGGIVMHEHEKQEHEQRPMVAARPAYVPLATTPPSGVPDASPAMLVVRARVENRLAIQASTMASRGECAGVVPTMRRLAEVDPALHRAVLANDPAVARCIAASLLTTTDSVRPSDRDLSTGAL